MKKKTAVEESRRRAAKLMKRLLMHFRAQMDEELRPYGATSAQMQLLAAVRDAPGSSGAHLSRLHGVTPQTMQALIQKTEECGWIVRGKDRVNERIVTAALTTAGEELLITVDGVMQTIEARLWYGVSREAVDALSEVLERCLENIAPA